MTFLFDWMSLLFTGFVFIISSLVILYRDDYMFGDLDIVRFIILVLVLACYFYTVYTPLTLHLRPEDGPVQGPKHVVFSLNKSLLQILQLSFDLPYPLPHLHL
jgi:hypothetical protein